MVIVVTEWTAYRPISFSALGMMLNRIDCFCRIACQMSVDKVNLPRLCTVSCEVFSFNPFLLSLTHYLQRVTGCNGPYVERTLVALQLRGLVLACRANRMERCCRKRSSRARNRSRLRLDQSVFLGATSNAGWHGCGESVPLRYEMVGGVQGLSWD